MPKRSDKIGISLDERLQESARQATSMTMPLAIHRRLDLLAEAAKDVAGTRSEIIGMLIAEAELDPEGLERRVIVYRKMRVRDALRDGVGGRVESSDNIIYFDRRGPGRPSRREAG